MGFGGLCPLILTRLEQKQILMDDIKYNTKLVLYHGSNDRVVPLEFAKFSFRNTLDTVGLEYDLQVEEGLRHKLSKTTILALSEFIEKRIKIMERDDARRKLMEME